MAVPVRLLRAELTQLLAGLLGTYTFANGSTTPAVRVMDDEDTTQAQVDGLELVISRQPASKPVNVYWQADCEQRWDLWLKDWASANATEAAERICYKYPGTTITPENSYTRKGVKRVLRLSFTDGNLLRSDTDIPPTDLETIYILNGDYI